MRNFKSKYRWSDIFVAVVIGIVVIGFVMVGTKETVMADDWNNAYEFYNLYGNSVRFSPSSQSDGTIYFGTKGANSNTSAGIRYRTIGWQISIVDEYGNRLQVMYCKLNGSYMSCEQQAMVSNDLYKLYGISLGTIKGRMTDSVKRVFEKGNCSIIFDACMVVVKNGEEQGGMTDGGPSWGNVYTTYDGIVNAQPWGSASKIALHSYFDKPVQGLYYTVNVQKSSGIAEVSGGGTYCYGTYVEISASAEYGYTFSHWSGTNVTYEEPYGFYVNGNYQWTAYAVPQKTKVVFHRNFDDADTVTMTQSYTYGNMNQQFINYGWLRAGYYPLGWSENRHSTINQYFLTNMVASQWIVEKYPEVHLYEIWKENEYIIVFDGNGATDGYMNSVQTTYTGSFQIPENQYVNRNKQCSFVGWSLNPISAKGEYEKGAVIQVSDLVTSLGLENTTGATIYLYAIWDEEPAIQAPDLYFSLLDAQQGKITEAVLSEYAKAVDLEDGTIPYGKNPNNSFLIQNFDMTNFLNCTTSTEFKVTFQAIDCSKNVVERSITVYIVDTSVRNGDEELGKPRIISFRYFEQENGKLLSEREGGIKESGKWRKNEAWRKLLEDTLIKAK